MPKNDSADERWYADGLKFECRRCNGCCGGEPGYVWVTREDVERMAEELGLSVDDFSHQYCRKVFWRTSLRERRNGDCVMLTEQGCAVYGARPVQCRTWPFWPDNISKPHYWEEVRERCPGAGSGQHYDADRIERIADGDEDV